MYRIRKALSLSALLLAVLLVLPGAGMRDTDAETPYTPAAYKYYGENQAQFESYQGFLRLDRDDIAAADGPLGNLRFITEGKYTLGEAEAKYNLDPDYDVSTEGLDTLNISASEQFSESQFHALADELRQMADGKEIVIVDLRAESHCFLNGVPVSWQELNNWGNLFLTPEEIEADEAGRFEPLLGQTVQVIGLPAGGSTEMAEMTVSSVTYERDLVESEGFTYLRIACTDHAMPTPAAIEAFIDFVKSIDVDNTWFHFHCVGGKGRTGTFMMLYDKMKNPGVPSKDIMYRHAQMGASYPIYTGSGSNAPMYGEKADITPLLYSYVEENAADGYEVSWSDWLRDKLSTLTDSEVPYVDVNRRAGEYTQITQDDAKERMTRDEGHVIVDVRRQDEYDEGHIPGAILIPNESIESEPPEALPDLDQIILIYCRSGNRSKQAAQKLADMGYTNIYEFGGILDWTGEITTD